MTSIVSSSCLTIEQLVRCPTMDQDIYSSSMYIFLAGKWFFHHAKKQLYFFCKALQNWMKILWKWSFHINSPNIFQQKRVFFMIRCNSSTFFARQSATFLGETELAHTVRTIETKSGTSPGSAAVEEGGLWSLKLTKAGCSIKHSILSSSSRLAARSAAS